MGLNEYGKASKTDKKLDSDTHSSDQTHQSEENLSELGETLSLNASADDGTKVLNDAPIPERVGRYDVHEVLGKGGFGAVYLGYDSQLDRRVAIKVPRLTITKELEKSFLEEARQLAQLQHPNIVTVHDVGVEHGVCFIVSEFLAGKSLHDWLETNQVSWEEAARIVATLADALAIAHAGNTVHRDVKPSNVIMTQRGNGVVAVLVDFGLALTDHVTGGVITERGKVAGTPNYMSPEQARGEGHRIDGRTDIYSLGVILYRMLSGKLPFAGSSVTELLQSVLDDEPRPPRQFVRGIPRELERICLKAMSKNIADRYTTASDLSEDLRNLLREHEDRLEVSASTSSSRDAPAKRDVTKILVADDHELTRFKLQTDLKKWGHQVTVAEDGEQAWELFQKHQYAIVITDWMMPKLNGLELVKMIRAAQTPQYVYVIMLTAKAEKHDIVAGMGAGADDFLTKPFHRDELQVRLRAGIRITNLNRELTESNRRLESSREAAAQIQRLFLPNARPAIDGLDVAWTHEPCGKLGGDMLNVVQLDPQHVAFYMLDVTGDGVPAALLATTLSRVLSPPADPASILVERDENGQPAQLRPPVEVGRILNQDYGTQEGKQYFTLTYAVLDLETHELQFTSAGHPPMLHLRKGESPSMLDIDSYPVGMGMEPADMQQRSLKLAAGDRLLIYSDGLTDAMSDQGEVFGAANLLDLLGRDDGEPVDALIQRVQSALRDWRGEAICNDDVSMLALHVD